MGVLAERLHPPFTLTLLGLGVSNFEPYSAPWRDLSPLAEGRTAPLAPSRTAARDAADAQRAWRADYGGQFARGSPGRAMAPCSKAQERAMREQGLEARGSRAAPRTSASCAHADDDAGGQCAAGAGDAHRAVDSGAHGTGRGEAAGRVVLHIDVDNFYCAVETADEPSLVGKPLVVTQSNSGGFVALSAAAKAAGLRKGDGVGARGRAEIESLRRMGSRGIDECRRVCPDLVVRPMRVDRYRDAGAAMLGVLQRWGVPVEKTSYDDYYVEAGAITAREDGRGLVPSRGAGESSGEVDAGAASRAKVWTDGACGCVALSAVVVDGVLAPDLRRGCELSELMRATVRAELGFTASVGVGRTKLVARMLSPAAKPDGVLTVADAHVAAFMATRRVVTLPGLQQKRGHELVAKLASGVEKAAAAMGHGSAPDDPIQLTLGDAMALAAPALHACVGGADAALLSRLAQGDDGGARVTPRGLPKQLASELSFPPTADVAKLEATLRGLASVLLRRLVAEAAERRRPPQRLVVTWREGYAVDGSTTRGAVHSCGVAWPAHLLPSARPREADASASEGGEHGRWAEELAASALRALRAKVPRLPELTRLVVAADFGSGHTPALGGAGQPGGMRQYLVAAPGPTTAPSTALVGTPPTAAGADALRTEPSDDEAPPTAAGAPAILIADEWSDGGGELGSEDSEGSEQGGDGREGGEGEPSEMDHDHIARDKPLPRWGTSPVKEGGDLPSGSAHDGGCPICGADLRTLDNSQVNAHVDLCLNAPQLPRAHDAPVGTAGWISDTAGYALPKAAQGATCAPTGRHKVVGQTPKRRPSVTGKRKVRSGGPGPQARPTLLSSWVERVSKASMDESHGHETLDPSDPS